MFEFIYTLDMLQLTTLIIAAILIGINKTAIPSSTTLPTEMLIPSVCSAFTEKSIQSTVPITAVMGTQRIPAS